jgi:hypothetical protein
MASANIAKFNDMLLEIYVNSRKKDNRTGLKYINKMMTGKILEYLEKNFEAEAKKYILKRDNENKKIKKQVENTIKFFEKNINEKTTGIKCVYKLMSSYQAGLNLLKESDIDVGCLVSDLDDIKLFKLTLEFMKYGFVPTTIYVNKHDEKNKYFSFEKDIDGISFEIKVRDAKDSATIVKLDEMVEKKLSHRQKCYYTYAKYITRNTDGYKYMKLFIAESVFYYIKDSYMFT